MALMSIFDVAGSAMTAQSERMNVAASNMANADSVTGPDGQPYRARQVVFQTDPAGQGVGGVRVAGVIQDPSPMKKVYDPKNPAADASGYVTMPNVDMTDEMVNMISASRSYQNNVEVMNSTRQLMQKTLDLGK